MGATQTGRFGGSPNSIAGRADIGMNGPHAAAIDRFDHGLIGIRFETEDEECLVAGQEIPPISVTFFLADKSGQVWPLGLRAEAYFRQGLPSSKIETLSFHFRCLDAPI